MAEAEEVGAEEDEDAAVKKEAEVEKKLGADAYKKRDFVAASTHFNKAWETWPKDVTFLTNLAGEAMLVLFASAVANVRVCIVVYLRSGVLRARRLRQVDRSVSKGGGRRP